MVTRRKGSLGSHFVCLVATSWSGGGPSRRHVDGEAKMAEGSAHCQIPNINASYEYAIPNGTGNETIKQESRRIFLPKPVLAVTDERGEMIHKLDGATLIIVMLLLVLTILTIWVFRAKRIRVCHSTGLAMLYGKGLLERTSVEAVSIYTLSQNDSTIPHGECACVCMYL